MVASSLHLHATTVAIKRRDSHERVANAEDDNKHESRLQPFGRLVVSSLHLHTTTVTIKRRDSHDIKEESIPTFTRITCKKEYLVLVVRRTTNSITVSMYEVALCQWSTVSLCV
jgi:hypothetical protein